MTCTRCGTTLRDGAGFCGNCGAKAGTPAAGPRVAEPPAARATVHNLPTIQPMAEEGPTAADTLAPGSTFADRYEVISLIGKGGMGTVYLARDTTTGRELALKLIRADRLRGEADVQRLINEGATCQNIRHRNVVAVYDVAQWKGQPYFTMEHVKGGSLRSWLVAQKQRRQDVPLPVAAGIVRAVLAGLDEAHRLGIVHRDLKPENLLLAGAPDASDFNLKIVDFGLAHVAGEGRRDGGGFAGTLGYMAPEQEEAADTVDATADIYSLSVIFYELLMGNRPNSRWEPISRHRREVPHELDALIERGLSVYQRSRPASAAEFSTALDAALAGAAPTPGPRVPDPEPPPPPPPAGESFLAKARRQWSELTMVQKAGTVTLGVVMAIAANWQPDPPPPPPPECNPAVEVCQETEDPPANTFAAGSWRDDAGNRFTAQHDGTSVRADGVIAGVGPVVITGTVTRASGASLVVTTAAGQPMYGGTGPVVPGNGGLDINLTFVYPNGMPAGQTTVHMNH